mmetsp:Transcript_3855/g.10653  ORF Transcript_3855/g.10653 Transcript_3855/m.10653 type:complete len:234 (+) Transcript_3855:717-1418(+)
MLTPHTRHPSTAPCLLPPTARLIATREDEHAVSTLRDGPCSPYLNDSLPAATLNAPPVAMKGLNPDACCPAMPLYSCCWMPTYTPVWLPAAEAPCRASQAASSSSRCWGSVYTASSPDIPNTPASNISTPCMKAPNRTPTFPFPIGTSTSRSHRSYGTSHTASTLPCVARPAEPAPRPWGMCPTMLPMPSTCAVPCAPRCGTAPAPATAAPGPAAGSTPMRPSMYPTMAFMEG